MRASSEAGFTQCHPERAALSKAYHSLTISAEVPTLEWRPLDMLVSPEVESPQAQENVRGCVCDRCGSHLHESDGHLSRDA